VSTNSINDIATFGDRCFDKAGELCTNPIKGRNARNSLLTRQVNVNSKLARGIEKRKPLPRFTG